MLAATLTAVMTLFAGSDVLARASTLSADPALGTSLRPQSRCAALLVQEAMLRSPILANMVKELDQSDVVAYIVDGMGSARSDVKSALTYVASHESTRYVMIRLDFIRLTTTERIVWLGHELHHALEIAHASKVRDVASLTTHYRKVGRPSGADGFETTGAQNATIQLRRDLLNQRRRAALPLNVTDAKTSARTLVGTVGAAQEPSNVM